ncbi:MAG: GNAT family N-acetyltransferase [Clostridia bacterium]|nr:GNAT family N-acetyltransferase [Clostridia bacterium]
MIENIETDRLVLREITEDDAEEMYKNWASDDEVSKYVRWSTHKNVEETKEYIKAEQERCKNQCCYNWGIVLKENQELIGAIGAFPSEDNIYELGYNIAKKHWNKGITTEALKRVLKYLINNKGMYRFRCSHAVLNPASGAVMRKAGFKYSHDDSAEKFDKSRCFDIKVYYLDIDKVKLVRPTEEHKKEIIEYKEEHFNNGETRIHACSKLDKMDNYDEWLNLLERNSKKDTVQSNWTVTTQFLGVREKDNKIVGMVNIRHELTTDFLKNYAGHIGYGIRPTERKKGYMTQMLAQSLKYCKNELNLEKVMLGCYKENVASRKTIVNAGGVLEREYQADDGKIVQIYWIEL